jgi:hypothetical protein
VESPETRYAKTLDGVCIAYQTVGDGPIDIVWQLATGFRDRRALDGCRSNHP